MEIQSPCQRCMAIKYGFRECPQPFADFNLQSSEIIATPDFVVFA